MEGFVICFNRRDEDGCFGEFFHEVLDSGVFIDEEQVERKVEELNQRFKKERLDYVANQHRTMQDRQRRWDDLAEHDLQEGPRPAFTTRQEENLSKEWYPGIGGTSYYSYSQVEINIPEGMRMIVIK